MEPNDGIDSLTKFNTELNKSMTLMDEAASKPPPKSRKRKSLKIDISLNSSTPGPSRLSDSISPRKSILKTQEDNELDTSFIRVDDSKQEIEEDVSIETTKIIERPRTLEELIKRDKLEPNTLPFALNLTDLDDDDELWVFDIPKSINPLDLKGQFINFDDKSKLKINGERFVATPNSGPSSLTCILGSGKEDQPCKAVNIQPSGTIFVRKKLPGPAKKHFDSQLTSKSNEKVQFPKNLRIRHPLLGVIESKKKKRKRSKKHSTTE